MLSEGKFDGNLKLISLNDRASQAAPLTVQAELQAVGFKISTAFMPAVAQARMAGSYDLIVTGVNVSEASPFIGLIEFTTSGRNASHYPDPQFDAAVGRLKAATDDVSTKAALKDIQDLWNQTYPAAALGSSEEVIAHSAKVKGLILGEESLVYFDKAFPSS